MSAAKENKSTLWKMSPPGCLPKGECKVRKVLENTQAPRFQVFTQGCGDTTEGIDKEGGIDKEEQSILCLKSETGLHSTAMSTCSLSASTSLISGSHNRKNWAFLNGSFYVSTIHNAKIQLQEKWFVKEGMKASAILHFLP